MKISFNIESDDEIKDIVITVNKSNGTTSSIKVKEGGTENPIVIPTPLAPPSPLIGRLETPSPFVQTSISGDAGSGSSGNGGMDETY